MLKQIKCCTVIVAVLAAPGFLLADDLTNSSKFLCSVNVATLCLADGECEIGMPWTWNIPEFIEVDLGRNTLATTKASGEARSTPIRNLQREGQQIMLQGVEGGRAFSIAVQETTGWASFAVAAEGFTISAFGTCTPLASKR